jgi:hypothetical protein
MASKVQVLLLDDVDGGTAVETVTFALDGSAYEIDLSAKNAQQLRESFTRWTPHARKSGRTARSGAPVRAARPSGGPDLNDVRSWARDNGFQVSDRGRISTQVMDAYQAAH